MKAFDTDILTEILTGNPAYAERIANLPADEQAGMEGARRSLCG
jgi:hypothetical protein